MARDIRNNTIYRNTISGITPGDALHSLYCLGITARDSGQTPFILIAARGLIG